jgi:hypothetical protein
MAQASPGLVVVGALSAVGKDLGSPYRGPTASVRLLLGLSIRIAGIDKSSRPGLRPPTVTMGPRLYSFLNRLQPP